MDVTDAMRITAHLKAAYTRMTLEEPEAELFIHEIAHLSDVTAALAAADRIIRVSERFPTVAEFRAQYRAVRPFFQRDEIPEATGRADEIPEYVFVWKWQMARTLTERQAARESNLPVAERHPMKMRDFPQFENPGRDAYSMQEYEQIRADWVAAGSPKMSAPELLTV